MAHDSVAEAVSELDCEHQADQEGMKYLRFQDLLQPFSLVWTVVLMYFVGYLFSPFVGQV